MSPRQRFFDLAERHGIEVDHDDCGPWLQIWSPAGKIFGSSGCHLDASFQEMTTESGRSFEWRDCVAELRQVIRLGLLDCPDGDACEACHPEAEPSP